MEANIWNLAGKRAFVTGGTKGIGKAIVSEFLHLGAEVIFVARNQEEINNVLRAFNEQELPVKAIAADISNAAGRALCYNMIEESWNGLDILVNNAGMNIRKKMIAYDEPEYDRIIATNLSSAFYLSQLFYPFLKASGNGSVVNISSVSGLTHIRSAAVTGGLAIGNFSGGNKGVRSETVGMWKSTNRPVISAGVNFDYNFYPNLAFRFTPTFVGTTFVGTTATGPLATGGSSTGGFQANLGFNAGVVYRFGKIK